MRHTLTASPIPPRLSLLPPPISVFPLPQAEHSSSRISEPDGGAVYNLGGDDERSEAGHSGRAASVATEDEGITAHHIHGAAAYEGTEDEESVQQQQQQTQEEEEQYVEVEEEQKEVSHGAQEASWFVGMCCERS